MKILKNYRGKIKIFFLVFLLLLFIKEINPEETSFNNNLEGYIIQKYFPGLFIFYYASIDPPVLVSPTNGAVNMPLTLPLVWNAVPTAIHYRVQVARDSNFTNIIVNDSTVTSTSKTISNLNNNSRYYWKVQAKNSTEGWGPFSSTWVFYTSVVAPQLVTIFAQNKQITIFWTQGSDTNIAKFRIYRGNTSPATTLIDSVAGSTLSYLNTGLTNGVPYYYRVKAVTHFNTESSYSNELNATPYNLPPVAAIQRDTAIFNSGRVLTRLLMFRSVGSYDPDGYIDSVFWYLNNQLVIASHNLDSLHYNFPQGTNYVKLIVQDNDGARDSSKATVNITVFKKFFSGNASGGLSLIGDSVLYAVISGPGGSSAVYKMDIDGNIAYPLNVNGNILSSSSIGYDTSVYIGSTDYNLYGFSRYGIALWPALPLGGQLSATPTIDSAGRRLYIGVSNSNFFAVRRDTGNIAWVMYGDAPIRNSAVITNDRKMILATEKGTIYGIDLNNLLIIGNVVTPNWTVANFDTISSSPAIDYYGYFYFGTKNGKLKKILLTVGQPGVIVWESMLGGSVYAAPVIDANSNVYVGSTNGKFFCLNPNNGAIKWQYQTPYSVRTTAAISDIHRIYLGNESGEIYSLDTNGNRLWYYKDSSNISMSLTYHKGTLYAGTQTGRVVALYDYAETDNFQPVTLPVWKTYQSNNRRTGSSGIQVMSEVLANNYIPSKYSLRQNYPNPFNPQTKISFDIPKKSFVRIQIFDITGREMMQLVNREFEAGSYTIEFNANFLSSGIYFYRMTAGDFTTTLKMAVIK